MKAFVVRLTLSCLLFATCQFTTHSLPPVAVDPPGIAFFKGSWKDALAEAKRQNKPIFLDVYTSWCPPCKRMEKEAFPNPRVGAAYNAFFINYQIDAERGEGPAIARQYLVSSYPTALFITPDGGLVHRAVGYGGVNAMIAQADHALSLPRLKTTLVKGDRDFAEGRRTLSFLKKYIQTRQALNRSIHDVLDAYIDALPESERYSAETVTFVATTIQSATKKSVDYLIKIPNRLLSPDLTGESLSGIVSEALTRVLTNDFEQAVMTRDALLLEKVIAHDEQIRASTPTYSTRPDLLPQEAASAYKLNFYKQTGHFVNYRATAAYVAQQLMSLSESGLNRLDSLAAVHRKNGMPLLPDLYWRIINNSPANRPTSDRLLSWKVAYWLNQMAGTYTDLGTSVTDWATALEWSERSISLYSTPEYVNTRARLLTKLGRQD